MNNSWLFDSNTKKNIYTYTIIKGSYFDIYTSLVVFVQYTPNIET